MTRTIIFFTILFNLAVHAQKQGQAFIDSLLARLPLLRDDTVKAASLCGLSFSYANVDTEKGLAYGRQALELSEQLHWQKGLSWSHNSIAVNYMVMSDYDK